MQNPPANEIGARRAYGTMIAVAAMAIALSGLAVVSEPAAANHRQGTLRRLAQVRHRLVGTAIGLPELTTDPEHLIVAAREYSSVTPENAMKWAEIHPEQGRYDFTGADQTVAFAEANRMSVRGHALVWHRQNPAWLTSGTFSRDELIAILRDHIHTVVGHFRDRVRQWDVVNEVVADDGSGLRDNLWLRGIGPEYVMLAFQFAHEADPHAKLFINDYLSETINPKSNFIYDYASLVRAYGIPIHGIGVQMHRFLLLPESAADIEANLRRLSDARFLVWITEMDVAVLLPADATKLADQATVYGEVVTACLRVRRCRGITTWGFTDRYSWIPGEFPGFGAGLPFDESLQAKPAYAAIAAALRG